MAIVDDGGTRRFPFLATIRSVVAMVVSVLTLVVVVMVITVALRPEDISLSILQGYIEADTLWDAKRITAKSSATIDTPFPHRGQIIPRQVSEPSSTGGVDDFESGTYYIQYGPASSVNLLIILSISNPSGRADITFENITVRVLDMPRGGYDVTRTVELQNFSLSDQFHVERQSSRIVRRMLTLNRKRALDYIAKNYAGETSFQAMVQVNATVGSSTTRKGTISHYCWPVTIALLDAAIAGDDVACKPREEIGYAIPPASSA